MRDKTKINISDILTLTFEMRRDLSEVYIGGGG